MAGLFKTGSADCSIPTAGSSAFSAGFFFRRPPRRTRAVLGFSSPSGWAASSGTAGASIAAETGSGADTGSEALSGASPDTAGLFKTGSADCSASAVGSAAFSAGFFLRRPPRWVRAVLGFSPPSGWAASSGAASASA